MPMLDIIDGMIEGRVGRTQPLDPNVLAQSTAGAFAMGTEQDNQLSEKLARIFAETGFKEMFLMIHELVIKHYDTTVPVKLKGNYVNISPTEWKKRFNLSVVVGLGTGNKDRQMGQLLTLIEKQENHLMQGSPLVTMKNAYNSYDKLVEMAGLKDVSLFFTDPDSPEAQQKAQEEAQNQQPDANMVMIEANKAIEDQKAQLVSQKQQQDAFFKKQEQDLKARELAVREVEAGIKTELEVAKIEQGRYEAELKAETSMALEQMKMGATIEQALSNQMSDLSIENDERLTAQINSLLTEINTMQAQNMMGMEGMAEGMAGQINQLAAQMARPKRVIYNDDGDPIGVEPV